MEFEYCHLAPRATRVVVEDLSKPRPLESLQLQCEDPLPNPTIFPDSLLPFLPFAYESLDHDGSKYGNYRDPCANVDAVFSKKSIKSQFRGKKSGSSH